MFSCFDCLSDRTMRTSIVRHVVEEDAEIHAARTLRLYARRFLRNLHSRRMRRYDALVDILQNELHRDDASTLKAWQEIEDYVNSQKRRNITSLHLTRGPIELVATLVDELDTMDAMTRCQVCFVKRRTIVSLPCRHSNMCYACATKVVSSSNKCIICRETIESIIKIYY